MGLHRTAALLGLPPAVRTFSLSLDLEDSETGCKFFRARRRRPVVLASENDGWFWDTEVMARARLADLRIREVPVLFLRRADKTQTVRFWRDSWRYLRALHDFRGVVGISRRTKSPIYWTGHGYDLVMRALYGGRVRTRRRGGGRAHRRRRQRRRRLLRDRAAAIATSCAPARCRYLGLDFNGDFVMHARRRGADVRWFNLTPDPIPRADYVVMCSSLYHFSDRADEIVDPAAPRRAPRGDRLGAGAQPVAAARGRAPGRGADQSRRRRR